MLPGTHSLHPKLVHEAYGVTTFFHPKLVPIYTCLASTETDTEHASCHGYSSPQTRTRSLCGLFSSTPEWCLECIHACFHLPKSDTEPASWHAFSSPQAGTQRLCSHYFPPTISNQTGAHLYMLAFDPKLILNMLSGTHSLHHNWYTKPM